MAETGPVFVHYVHYRQNKISSSKPPVQESVALGVLGHDYDQTLARARQSFPSLDGSARLELCLLPSHSANASGSSSTTAYLDEHLDQDSVMVPLTESSEAKNNKATLGLSRTWPRLPRDVETWRMIMSTLLSKSAAIDSTDKSMKSSADAVLRPALVIALLETYVDEPADQTAQGDKTSLESTRSSSDGTLVGTEYPPPRSSGHKSLPRSKRSWVKRDLYTLIPALAGLFILYMIGTPAESPFPSYTGPGIPKNNYSISSSQIPEPVLSADDEQSRVVTYAWFPSQWKTTLSYNIAPIGSTWNETIAIARRIDPHLSRFPDSHLSLNLVTPGIRPNQLRFILISPEGFLAATQMETKGTMIGIVAKDLPGELLARIVFIPLSIVTLIALVLGVLYNSGEWCD